MLLGLLFSLIFFYYEVILALNIPAINLKKQIFCFLLQVYLFHTLIKFLQHSFNIFPSCPAITRPGESNGATLDTKLWRLTSFCKATRSNVLSVRLLAQKREILTPFAGWGVVNMELHTGMVGLGYIVVQYLSLTNIKGILPILKIIP